MREKSERENALHTKLRRFSASRGSPSPSRRQVGASPRRDSPEPRVLSPTRKHEHQENRSSDTFGLGVMSSGLNESSGGLTPPPHKHKSYGASAERTPDVYGLGVSSHQTSPFKSKDDRAQRLLDYTRRMENGGELRDDEKPPECQQS